MANKTINDFTLKVNPATTDSILIQESGGTTKRSYAIGRGLGGVASNTAYGVGTLASSTSGAANCANGEYSLSSLTTGTGNSAYGASSLLATTTGGLNTAIGLQAGDTLTTGSNNSMIGHNAQPSAVGVSNEITLGNASVDKLRCQVDVTVLSDERDKTEIEEIDCGLLFIKELKPKKYKMNPRERYEGVNDGSKKDKNFKVGFIAQELKEAQLKTGTEYFALVSESNPDKLEVTYSHLYPVIVKALQELLVKIEILETKIAKLQK